jgi:large subunit ribosomal protein L21
VLAVFTEDGARADFGTPTLSAKVTCKVISHQRGDKIRVLKFKRKNRYERNFGHRSYQTTLSITSLDV